MSWVKTMLKWLVTTPGNGLFQHQQSESKPYHGVNPVLTRIRNIPVNGQIKEDLDYL